MRRLFHLLKLIRLHNCLLAGIGVWLGGYLTAAYIHNYHLTLAALAAALVCGAGNAVNDFLDIEADKINHPSRPLPRGDLPLYLAILIAATFNIAALVLAALVNGAVLGVVFFAIILLLAYNFSLKKMPLWGNLAVSLLGGLTFLTGALVYGYAEISALPGPLVPAIFAFLFHFGRELIKDIQDSRGDIRVNLRTLPIIAKRRNIIALVTLVYLLLICLTFIPMWSRWYNMKFNLIVIFLVDWPLLGSVFYLLLSSRAGRFRVVSSILKVLMLLGIIAFFLGKKAPL